MGVNLIKKVGNPVLGPRHCCIVGLLVGLFTFTAFLCLSIGDIYYSLCSTTFTKAVHSEKNRGPGGDWKRRQVCVFKRARKGKERGDEALLLKRLKWIISYV